MKRTKKIRLFWVNILMVTVLCGAVFAQLYGNVSTLFAKTPLSITRVDSVDVSENQTFVVELSDTRDVKELGTTIESDPREIVTFDSSSKTEDLETDTIVEMKREWKVTIPEGLSFDEEAERAMLLEADKDAELPLFNWNEKARTLNITAISSQTTLDLLLKAEKAGDYKLNYSSADEVERATELAITIAKADSSSSEVESPAPVAAQTRSLRAAGTADVTDWESFVRALADTSITTISLQNDITLSGTLQNYDGLFSTASVDMTSADNVYLFINKAASSRSITIEGNSHTFDFGNLAIGLLNASTTGSTQAFWVFDFVNIDVLSRNFSGPIYKSSHTAASATTNGLTGTARTNTQINFGNGATHTRQVTTMLGYLVALNDYNVPNIEVMTDLWTTSGTMVQSYFLYSPNSNASTQVFGTTSATNNSGGMVHIYFTAMNGNARAVNVEGNGYTLDFGALVYHFMSNNNNGGVSWDISFNNMTVYHGNYWGAIIYNAGGKMTMNNYTGYGAQFMEADTTNLVLAGKTHLEQVASYTSLAKDGSTIRTWSVNNERQSSLSVSTATVADNADLYLGSRGSNVLEVSGGMFDIGDNAKVTLERGAAVLTSEGGNANLTIRNSGAFNVGKGSIVDMVNHHASNATVVNLQGAGATFHIEEEAVVNIRTDAYAVTSANNSSPGTGTGSSGNVVYIGGGSMTVAGTLNVKTENMAAASSAVIYAGAAAVFTVNAKGSMDIQSDSNSYNQNLIYMAGAAASTTFQFSDAERVNLQRTVALSTGTNNANSGLIRSAGNLNVSVQNVYQWNLGNYNGGGDGDSNYNYDYVPMSNMTLAYGGNAQPAITTANAMTSATLASFKANFTTQTQRVLFTRIPDPNVAIHSISTDNHADSSSTTVYGYAIPNTYIRIWDETLNASIDAAFDPSTDSISSPVDDTTTPEAYRKNFSTQADANGDWSITVPSGNYFTAHSTIRVYAFANLKAEERSQVVLDRTPPTGDPVEYHSAVGETAPGPEKFVVNPADTNPITPTFGYEFAEENTAAQVAAMMNTQGEYPIYVYLSDNAVDADGNATPNKTKIQAKLIVHDTLNFIEAEDATGKASDINSLTEAELKAWIISKSNAAAAKIVDGAQSSLTDKIQVTNLGGLTPATTEGAFNVVLTVKASDSGLSTDLTTTIQVYIYDDNTVISTDEDYALKGANFTVASKDYPTTAAGIVDMIRSDGQLKLTQIQPAPATDLPVTDIVIDTSNLPPARITGVVTPAGNYDVPISYGTGDSRVEKTIVVTISQSEAKLHVRFVDENDQDIVPQLEIDVMSGELYDLTGNPQVSQKIEAAKGAYYDLDARPASEDAFLIDQTVTTAIYKFTGKLVISSVPSMLDFGLEESTSKKIRVENADLNGDKFAITDTRPVRKEWKLTAKLLQEFTLLNDANTTLTGILRYNDGGTNEKTFALNAAEDIAQHTNADKEYVLSDIWQEKGPGFKLEITNGAVKKLGEYQAVIEYQLADTP